MNVRVTDADGRQLAAGPRPGGHPPANSAQQAAESFSRVEDPRWNRDGLTEWDFDELPAEIELPRGRLSVKAYPALLDRDDSVSLRLVDSPRRAEHETHFGLRRLCFLAAQRELKTQVDWLPNLDCDGSSTRRRCRASICAGSLPSCWPTGPWWPTSPCRAPRTSFERLLAAGRERIAWAVQELVAVVRPLFEGYHQASLAIEEFCRRGRSGDIAQPGAAGRRRHGGASRH